jgi:TRAP-type C4-dicarboxylate transport system permease small subunit
VSFAYQEDKGGVAGPHPSFDWHPGWLRFLRAAIRLWALLGGLIVVALVLISAASAGTTLFFNKPIQGDYELVKHFVAVAVFCFLPYCQLTGGNVTVDIFTEAASERTKAAMLAFSSLFAIAFALLLLRQMYLGLLGYIEYPETTAALHIPLWTAFPPALVSLVLLLVAAVVTLVEGIHGMRQPPVPTD